MPKQSNKRKRDEEYFAEPKWGATHAARGGSGTRMTVILGPGAIAPTNYGSKPGATSIPRCMKKLNALNFKIHKTRSGKDVKKGLWIAGHLMNDNMGGKGTQNTNLTALTGTANKKHSGLETRIKSALTVSSTLERFKQLPEFTFAVDYQVDVVGQFAPSGDHALAPEYIHVTSKLVKLDADTGAITDATDADLAMVLDKTSRTVLANATFSEKVYNEHAHLS